MASPLRTREGRGPRLERPADLRDVERLPDSRGPTAAQVGGIVDSPRWSYTSEEVETAPAKYRRPPDIDAFVSIASRGSPWLYAAVPLECCEQPRAGWNAAPGPGLERRLTLGIEAVDELLYQTRETA